jgi:translation initiation factor 1
MERTAEKIMALVYSTDQGRLCDQCAQPKSACRCKQQPPAAPRGDGFVRLQRQTQGRAGKAVIVISGLELAPTAMKALAKDLKQRCGCGGSIKDNTIEMQGDHRAALQAALEQLGYKVKLSGG